VSLEKIPKAVSYLGPTSLPVVVAQPDKRHANIIASALECMTITEQSTATSGSNKEERSNFS